MTTTTKPTAAQARQLHDAETAVKQLKAQLDLATETLDAVRARVRPRLVLSDEPSDRERGILVATAGGIVIRVAPCISGEYFSLKDYKAGGHTITPEMAEHISPGREYDRWTVKTASGPKRHDAVEPTR